MPAQTISEQECKELLNATYPTAVSLYVPTDSTNPDPRMNSIAFKNLVQKAIDQLKALKITDMTSQTLRKISENLLKDQVFWKDQIGSFAVLVAGTEVKTFRLAKSHPELLMISDHFYVMPLLAQCAQKANYYVLELDQEHTQLWKGDQDGLTVVTVPDMPKSVAEATGTETDERNLQFHTSTTSPGGGERPAMFHGSSSWKDDHDRYLERFLHEVDHAVSAFLTPLHQPLLLSGVEESVVKFKKISKYPRILTATLPKMPDPTHKEERLHAEAVKVILMYQEDSRKNSLKSFEETVPAKKVSTLPDVLRQAGQGKIDTLFLAEDKQIWGEFDTQTLSTITDVHQNPRSAELLNIAASLTLQNSGKVLTVPVKQMPDGVIAAATLRY